MKTQNKILLVASVMAGIVSLAGAVGAAAAPTFVQEPIYAGRRADHVPLRVVPAAERAEFAALTSESTSVRTEPAYSGRRADHVPAILSGAKERAEFAAMEGRVDGRTVTPKSEPAYAGRRADHLEMLRR